MKAAKARKLPVTFGVSMHHLSLNEEDIGPYRTFFKLRPPLRSEEDRSAMVRALASGDIDVVVSSHDPQDADVKRRPFAEAEPGAIGLETLLASLMRLHHEDRIPLGVLLRPLTINPAKILGLASGRLEKGAPADLTVFDPNQSWVVDRDLMKARSKNTPFDEKTLQGRVLRTLVAGKTVYQYA
jgi:dihydroorotase